MFKTFTVFVLVVSVCIGIALTVFEGLQHAAFHELIATSPKTKHETTTGDCGLPIVYFDGSLVGSFYLVDAEVANDLLPDDLAPLTLPIVNKAVAGIFMFDYRNTTIGPYEEMGLTIQARQRESTEDGFKTFAVYLCDIFAHLYHLDSLLDFCGHESTGLYVVTLPVTTENAKAAGRELWGYNKYLTPPMPNDFSNPDKMTFELPNEFTFALDSTASTFPTLSMSGLPFCTYSKKDSELIRTIIRVGHKATWGGKTELKIIGQGDTADKLKLLGIDQMEPVAVFRTDELKAHLPIGNSI